MSVALSSAARHAPAALPKRLCEWPRTREGSGPLLFPPSGSEANIPAVSHASSRHTAWRGRTHALLPCHAGEQGHRATGRGDRGTGRGHRGTGRGDRGTGRGHRGTGRGHRGTGAPGHRTAGPPGPRATGPPGHRAAGPPGRRATGPQRDCTTARGYRRHDSLGTEGPSPQPTPQPAPRTQHVRTRVPTNTTAPHL
ncbi:hypothetical protein EDF62_1048 [Leucobacter luti]|uniref:Uncharacterized protein n=1 Tax=Leucobacter luti TaxID=340320 RepID=A0A4R6S618_9MICO|nr:hypothetical protein EDF62_1048 [Leucobacter luti]